MCYRFTTPLRRRNPRGFASAQARKLVALGCSSFSAATRYAGLAPEDLRCRNPRGFAFAQARKLFALGCSSFSAATRNAGLASEKRGDIATLAGPLCAHGKNSGIGRLPIPLFVGWVKGLEPSTPGTTIRCSNQLSYTHHRENGTPEGTRTPGLLLRRQLLYPTELLAHIIM